jgi:hypothetical protein
MIEAVQNVFLLAAIAALPSHAVDVMKAATGMLASAVAADAVVVDADAAAAVAGVYQFLFSIVAVDAAVYCNKYQSACLKGHWTQDPLLPPKDLLLFYKKRNYKKYDGFNYLPRPFLT